MNRRELLKTTVVGTGARFAVLSCQDHNGRYYNWKKWSIEPGAWQ